MSKIYLFSFHPGSADKMKARNDDEVDLIIFSHTSTFIYFFKPEHLQHFISDHYLLVMLLQNCRENTSSKALC